MKKEERIAEVYLSGTTSLQLRTPKEQNNQHSLRSTFWVGSLLQIDPQVYLVFLNQSIYLIVLMSKNPTIYPIFYTAALYPFSRMEREKLKQTV